MSCPCQSEQQIAIGWTMCSVKFIPPLPYVFQVFRPICRHYPLDAVLYVLCCLFTMALATFYHGRWPSSFRQNYSRIVGSLGSFYWFVLYVFMCSFPSPFSLDIPCSNFVAVKNHDLSRKAHPLPQVGGYTWAWLNVCPTWLPPPRAMLNMVMAGAATVPERK